MHPSSCKDCAQQCSDITGLLCFVGWLATVDQGQTINLYKLCDVLKSTEAGLITQPWHMILSQHPISTLSFIEDNVLAGGSNSVKSVSLWVGIDNIGSIE